MNDLNLFSADVTDEDDGKLKLLNLKRYELGLLFNSWVAHNFVA